MMIYYAIERGAVSDPLESNPPNRFDQLRVNTWIETNTFTRKGDGKSDKHARVETCIQRGIMMYKLSELLGFYSEPSLELPLFALMKRVD